MKTAKTTKPIALLGGALLFGSALIPLTSYAAENASVTASMTILSALSMYIDNDDGKGDVKVTDENNTWTKEFLLYPGEYSMDQFTKVTIRTNAPQGYSVTLQGEGEGTGGFADLVMGDGLETGSRITSSKTTPGANADESTWGIRLAKVRETNPDDAHDGDWQAIPDSTGKALPVDSGNGPTAGSATYVYYGLASGVAQMAGTYTGAIKFTATAYGSACINTITGTMQRVYAASAYCDGATGVLTDTRDGNTYEVAKLADRKIWMLQNLRLGMDATTGNYKSVDLTSSDSNLPEGVSWSLPANTTTGTNGTFSHSATNYQTKQIHVATDADRNTSKAYSGSGDTFNVAVPDVQTIGVYYNYCAASAGQICAQDDTDGTKNATSPATQDICPKGWHLPSGGYTVDDAFSALVNAYRKDGAVTSVVSSSDQGYADFNNAFKTVMAGNYDSGSLNNGGSYAYWWSSTPYGASSATSHFGLYVNTSSVFPANRSRYYGLTVRCVAGQ